MTYSTIVIPAEAGMTDESSFSETLPPDFATLYGPDQPLDRFPVSPPPGYIRLFIQPGKF
jgi:hypothetical protein